MEPDLKNYLRQLNLSFDGITMFESTENKCYGANGK
jgi:hypothetical protein